MFFFNLADGTIWNKQSISPLWKLIPREYTFQKLTQFLQGNNVLDAPASDKSGFLSGDTCVSSTQPNMPICRKHSLSPP
jgi:hypothetical protein